MRDFVAFERFRFHRQFTTHSIALIQLISSIKEAIARSEIKNCKLLRMDCPVKAKRYRCAGSAMPAFTQYKKGGEVSLDAKGASLQTKYHDSLKSVKFLGQVNVKLNLLILIEIVLNEAPP